MTTFIEEPIKLSFTVEVRNSCYDVVLQDGRRCNGLGWDEMLGQVAHLTHPKLQTQRYMMLTTEEWAQHWAKLSKRDDVIPDSPSAAPTNAQSEPTGSLSV